MRTNHYGIMVDTHKPITGVFTNNRIEFLYEDMDNGVDVQCHECDVKDDEGDECYGCNPSDHTHLIGFKQVKGQWEPDKSAEYSAIVGEVYTQVVWSRYVIRCDLCSPCFPGQGDPDSEGPFLAYSIPPDVLGDDSSLLNKVIPYPPKSKEDLVKEQGLEDKSFDYALPQSWVEEVYQIVAKGGYSWDDILCGFIWLYDVPYRLFGYPFPLTYQAGCILATLTDKGRRDLSYQIEG